MEACEHIKNILMHEEERGNKIKEKSEGWSKANLVIDMEKSIDVDYANSLIQQGAKLRYWENNDTHYVLQKGYFCNECKQSIAGPK